MAAHHGISSGGSAAISVMARKAGGGENSVARMAS